MGWHWSLNCVLICNIAKQFNLWAPNHKTILSKVDREQSLFNRTSSKYCSSRMILKALHAQSLINFIFQLLFLEWRSYYSSLVIKLYIKRSGVNHKLITKMSLSLNLQKRGNVSVHLCKSFHLPFLTFIVSGLEKEVSSVGPNRDSLIRSF